jgi:hypothetical protein
LFEKELFKNTNDKMYEFILEVFDIFSVVESHPDNAHEDLRLDGPFDGLVKFIDSIDLSSMSKKVMS